MKEHKGSVLGGALLVAGTSIGGGMLALPVLTALGGYLPTLVLYLLSWLFMAGTGLLFMEVFLWSKNEVNFVSMAQMTLGGAGKVFAWIVYLFLFYSLSIAYVSGGGDLVCDVLEVLEYPQMPSRIGPVIFVLLFAPFVVTGAWAVDRINWVLMSGLILSFLAFVVLGFSHVQLKLFSRASWPFALAASPVIFTSFAFQGIVPTLTNYLKRNPKRVRRAILIGSALTLTAYVIWEWLILGTVPLGGLEEARTLDKTAVYPFKKIVQIPWLFTIGEFFAFFAIVTSFLGVTLGLFDFLADGLKVKKTVRGRFFLSLLIYGPPLIFSMIYPKLFLVALKYGGGFGCALILGLLPILMTWRGRYFLGYKSAYSLPGGRFTLTLMLLFLGIVFFSVILTQP